MTFGDMTFKIGLTVIEVFNDLYQQGNPIPMEYQMNPVDYRVDIYSIYSDELQRNLLTKEIIFTKNLMNKIIAILIIKN